MNQIPASVLAMAEDPGAPTAPVRDFIIAMGVDDNWWWRVGCGHHLNLFEELVEGLEELERRLSLGRYAP